MAAEKEKAKDKAAPPEAQDGEDGSKKKKMILFGGIGAGVVVIGAAAFFMLKSPSRPSEDGGSEHEQGGEHGEAPAEAHGEEKAEEGGHGEKKEEGHGEKKKEEKSKEKEGSGKSGGEHGEKSSGSEHGGDKGGEKKGEGGHGESEGGAKKEASSEAANIDFGQTFSLKTFHLNLGNPLENRFLRMEISVEYKGGDEQKAELEARSPQLRDAIVSVTGKKTREFLLGPDGKDQLRLEILNRINQFMDRKVESVYITDFLIE